MGAMEDAEFELGCDPGELEGTFPSGLVKKMSLAVMVERFENSRLMDRDYEVRKLIYAYHDGMLDPVGLSWLIEELEEYFND